MKQLALTAILAVLFSARSARAENVPLNQLKQCDSGGCWEKRKTDAPPVQGYNPADGSITLCAFKIQQPGRPPSPPSCKTYSKEEVAKIRRNQEIFGMVMGAGVGAFLGVNLIAGPTAGVAAAVLAGLGGAGIGLFAMYAAFKLIERLNRPKKA